LRAKYVGDTAFVVRVADGGAADRAGIRPGDEVLSVGPEFPTRRSFQRIWYRTILLNPRESMSLSFRDGEGEIVEKALVPEPVSFRPFYFVPEGYDEWFSPWNPFSERAWRLTELRAGVSVWRFDQFDAKDRGRFRAAFQSLAGGRALVLDLRENVGGSLEVLVELVRYLFPGEVVTVGSFRQKDGLSALKVEPGPGPGFRGEVVVLVGSGTGSAAEVLASVVQEKGRGQVVGDRTAGAVMLSGTRRYQVREGEGHWEFGLSISLGEFRTASGMVLEGRGVLPDETVLPTRIDLERGDDPLLSQVLGRLGLSYSPAEAGRILFGEG
jgi:C-terminal processing protease CtpA/Prc